MPPQRRQSDVQVEVDPPEAALPRAHRRPTKKAVAAAVEKSAEHLAAQEEPPADVHPKPTTPTKAAVEEAVQRSAEHLEEQDQKVEPRTLPPRAAAPVSAAPVSASGPSAVTAAAPVYGGRDKTKDATPVFTAPISDKPKD